MITDASSDIGSEDFVGFARRGSALTAWAIDGASALTELPYVTFPSVTDAQWFAKELSASLSRTASERPFSPRAFSETIRALRERYMDVAGDLPVWAFPVAACSIVELIATGNGVATTVYLYADCFVLLERLGVRPMRKDASCEIPRARARWKPCSGFSGKQLEYLRQRRIQQQIRGGTSALTLDPSSAERCKVTVAEFPQSLHLLIGTDGLARAWQRYHLISPSEVLKSVAEHGLTHLFRRVRSYEESAVHEDPREKVSDDAAGLYVWCDGEAPF